LLYLGSLHHREIRHDLQLKGKERWWELREDFYYPRVKNLKNFKPVSGLLHRSGSHPLQ
jgi:hypothetical protein